MLLSKYIRLQLEFFLTDTKGTKVIYIYIYIYIYIEVTYLKIPVTFYVLSLITFNSSYGNSNNSGIEDFKTLTNVNVQERTTTLPPVGLL